MSHKSAVSPVLWRRVGHLQVLGLWVRPLKLAVLPVPERSSWGQHTRGILGIVVRPPAQVPNNFRPSDRSGCGLPGTRHDPHPRPRLNEGSPLRKGRVLGPRDKHPKGRPGQEDQGRKGHLVQEGRDRHQVGAPVGLLRHLSPSGHSGPVEPVIQRFYSLCLVNMRMTNLRGTERSSSDSCFHLSSSKGCSVPIIELMAAALDAQ